jgi:hypothetical protein
VLPVGCYQDLQGDGIHEWPNGAGELVSIELWHPDEQSPSVEPAPSVCGTRGGGECKAVPYAYGSKDGRSPEFSRCRIRCDRPNLAKGTGCDTHKAHDDCKTTTPIAATLILGTAPDVKEAGPCEPRLLPVVPVSSAYGQRSPLLYLSSVPANEFACAF